MATCRCGKLAIVRTSWTDNNPGRRFYSCPSPDVTCPGFVGWVDPPCAHELFASFQGYFEQETGRIKNGMNFGLN
ncbi:putative transcription factor GRF family [Helianthus annuus]|nr:putative transcription factor GRF family [Helianthus annuus]